MLEQCSWARAVWTKSVSDEKNNKDFCVCVALAQIQSRDLYLHSRRLLERLQGAFRGTFQLFSIRQVNPADRKKIVEVNFGSWKLNTE